MYEMNFLTFADILRISTCPTAGTAGTYSALRIHVHTTVPYMNRPGPTAICCYADDLVEIQHREHSRLPV